ncbi:thiol reductant ABC exporter subunit CydD [Actinomadura chibensis]|uniref:Thiol reductant ABC exporter subunit CydD n=1 Tax=Actinomadura chibensis TaxID=392828 RepID=A0A5D0NML4_9ACTN|nr:thiol reductant ABC exporter subunit CydD [Actinomadura chibensis]TYB45518.1 thiol reductant ABC exporter subunit CydD [Actinomadura chibensis]
MRATDSWLPRHVPGVRRLLAAAGLAAACSAVLTIVQVVLFADVVVAGFLRHRGVRDLAPSLLCLAAVAAARAAVGWARDAGCRVMANRIVGELRGRVLRRLTRVRPGRVTAAEAVTAAVDGGEALETYLARFLPQVTTAALAPPAILAWVAFHDVPSALVMLVTLPLIPLFGALIGRATEARTRARLRALTRMSGHFLDVVTGLPTLRAYRRGRAQADAVADTTERYRRETMGVLRIAFLSAFVLELAATLGTALVAVGIGLRLVTGGLGLDAGLAILVLAPELYGPLRGLAAEYHAGADGMAAARRIGELLALPPAVPAPPGPARPARFGVLRLADVTVRYDDGGPPVLEDVSLEIRPGERTVVLGESGAGKSTLLALLLRFVPPSSGLVTVDGTDLSALDPDEWRRLVGWLPQRPRLRPGPALQAVGSADPAGAAELVGAGALLRRTVGENGAGLSAGEVRRLALARALARPAPLLLLDEPTAHLDAAAARLVVDAVRALPGRTVVVATHDARLAEDADQVVELAAGRARRGADALT